MGDSGGGSVGGGGGGGGGYSFSFLAFSSSDSLNICRGRTLINQKLADQGSSREDTSNRPHVTLRARGAVASCLACSGATSASPVRRISVAASMRDLARDFLAERDALPPRGVGVNQALAVQGSRV